VGAVHRQRRNTAPAAIDMSNLSSRLTDRRARGHKKGIYPSKTKQEHTTSIQVVVEEEGRIRLPGGAGMPLDLAMTPSAPGSCTRSKKPRVGGEKKERHRLTGEKGTVVVVAVSVEDVPRHHAVTSRGQVATSRRPQLGRLPRRRRASPHAAPRVVRDPEGATRGLDLLWRWAQERSRMLNLF
jgi:hypothetical protein